MIPLIKWVIFCPFFLAIGLIFIALSFIDTDKKRFLGDQINANNL